MNEDEKRAATRILFLIETSGNTTEVSCHVDSYAMLIRAVERRIEVERMETTVNIANPTPTPP